MKYRQRELSSSHNVLVLKGKNAERGNSLLRSKGTGLL